MDNTLFSCLTHNPQPLHIDHDFAAKTEWGKPLVNSMFTLGLMIGVSVGDTTLGTTIGNLGMTEVKFPKPVFHGDTLHVTTEVLAKRESRRGPMPASSSSCTRPTTSAASWWPNAGARP